MEIPHKPGAYVTLFGVLIIITGMPMWIVGRSKNKKIGLGLQNFRTTGSAFTNGIYY
jgi:hypothetical protein